METGAKTAKFLGIEKRKIKKKTEVFKEDRQTMMIDENYYKGMMC